MSLIKPFYLYIFHWFLFSVSTWNGTRGSLMKTFCMCLYSQILLLIIASGLGGFEDIMRFG